MVRVHPDPPTGAIAQPGEHRLCKPGVGGSNPPGSTNGTPWPAAFRGVARSVFNRSLTMWKVRCNEGEIRRISPREADGASDRPRVARDARSSEARFVTTPGFGVSGSSDQAHAVDALATTGDERRGSLRKAPGSWQTSVEPEMSEWGNPPARVSIPEFIRDGGEPGELKHLSTRRNRNQPRFRQ